MEDLKKFNPSNRYSLLSKVLKGRIMSIKRLVFSEYELTEILDIYDKIQKPYCKIFEDSYLPVEIEIDNSISLVITNTVNTDFVVRNKMSNIYYNIYIGHTRYQVDAKQIDSQVFAPDWICNKCIDSVIEDVIISENIPQFIGLILGEYSLIISQNRPLFKVLLCNTKDFLANNAYISIQNVYANNISKKEDILSKISLKIRKKLDYSANDAVIEYNCGIILNKRIVLGNLTKKLNEFQVEKLLYIKENIIIHNVSFADFCLIYDNDDIYLSETTDVYITSDNNDSIEMINKILVDNLAL